MITIGNKQIGDGKPCFIIAEAGINHNGDIKLAQELVKSAAQAGVNAIKFQTHFPEDEMLKGGFNASYLGESLFDLLKRVSLSKEDHFELKELAEEHNLIFLSTPFCKEAANFLEQLGVLAFKTGSGELTNLPLLEHIARKGKPMIISTGMSIISEIDEAVNLVKNINSNFVLMHCTSTYPALPEYINLRFIQQLKTRYSVPVGFSDHTRGVHIALAAVAQGANLIEKHFTISRNLPGPDQKASLEPKELNYLVKAIRDIEKSAGTEKIVQPGEQEVRDMAAHSVVSLKEIPAGKVIGPDDVWVKRPGTGIPAKYLTEVIGKKARQIIPKDNLIKWEDLEF